MEPPRGVSPQAWCVYILSNKAHTLYVGSTNDLLRRRAEHKWRLYPNAVTARYTFDRCVYYELLDTEEAARTRETEIKGWTRARKVELIQSVNPWWHDRTPDLSALFRK